MEETEKELYARKLAKRAEAGLIAVKTAFFAVAAVALAFVVFAVVAACIKLETEAQLTGYIVFAALIAVLLCSVIAAFVYAKVNLEKLKKLK